MSFVIPRYPLSFLLGNYRPDLLRHGLSQGTYTWKVNFYLCFSLCIEIPIVPKIENVNVGTDLSRYSKSYFSISTGLNSSIETSCKRFLSVQDKSVGKSYFVFLELEL